MNILSMRGPWYKQSGTAAATYDTATQSLVFDPTTTKTVQVNANNTGMTRVMWAVPTAGSYVKFAVIATGDATLRLQVKTNGVVTYDSNNLANGQSQRFIWPGTSTVTLIATSGTSGASSVKAELVPSP
jgi:allophanate hydrolase subunit 2